MKTLLLLLLVSLLALPTLAQATWTGTTSTDWNTAANWNPAGVPTATTDVVIPTASNNPRIGAGTAAVANSVLVQDGATLTIVSSASLTINGSRGLFGSSTAFLNLGTFTNAAALTIGNLAPVGQIGLWNQASFSNYVGGHIQIDNAGSYGLYNLRGTFINETSIVIGATAPVGAYGLRNQGPFSNNLGGTIQIDRSADRGLYNQEGSFTNAAALIIGATASVGRYGLILNGGTRFDNNRGGEIRIDRSTLNGLNNGGTFTNAAALTIGGTAPVGECGLDNGASFSNNACANLSLFAPINNASALTNDGFLTASTTQTHINTGFTNTGVIVYTQGNPIPNVTNNGIFALPLTTCGPTATPALQIGDGNRFSVGTTWYKESGLSTPVGAYSPNTFTATSAAAGGTYPVFFSLTDPANSCNQTVSIPLTVSPVATISPGSATLTCASPTTTLTASGGGTGETLAYRWDDNSTNALRTVSTAGTYSVTVTADNGCTAMASAVVSADCGTPPTSPFSITGVTTVSCASVTAGERMLSFSPRYAGLSGQPISFSIVNEMLPTTAPGPYTLRVYTDNPTITLKATQRGTAGEASFAYNWLAACTGSARIGAEPVAGFEVRVLGNPGRAGQVWVEVRGVSRCG